MIVKTKSDILREVGNALDKKESFDAHWALKKSPYMVKIKVEMEQPDFFIDENGVKWIPASSAQEYCESHSEA